MRLDCLLDVLRRNDIVFLLGYNATTKEYKLQINKNGKIANIEIPELEFKLAPDRSRYLDRRMQHLLQSFNAVFLPGDFAP